MVIAVTEHARRPGCYCAPCRRPPEAPAIGDTIIVGRVKYRIVRIDEGRTARQGALVLILTNTPSRPVTHQLVAAADGIAWSPMQQLWRLTGASRVWPITAMPEELP